ncbi:ABC transporter ATP-binding protein [Candidatus Symbiopectobacterium sp. 'North America']|uniref:ABC transporter ATP-binding protein n=1 Tax=Candidatus Symbiopectobacterium sp. 'North America' TaxID=2794574 RepID=UPI0018CA5917|nr:ATP-binding cassette domain-containing protein [Candidatus Symbiopectobacterium sp. 'North America']MBG6244485.1 ABC transporter ATP-binding protein [Candidatus Symbiopectobacterium sp. 'North America']
MGVAHNPQEAVIETRQLYKRFGQVTALENINIRIQRGEFVAIMGASGSGKTTLMNILTCLDTLTEGQVLLDGVDAAALDEEGRRRFRADKIGLVFQQFHLIPFLTALENVMLVQVGLEHRTDHLPSQLSEENEQRVLALLQDLHHQGRTIVMVTHNPELGRFADRIIRLQHGKYLSEEVQQHAVA